MIILHDTHVLQPLLDQARKNESAKPLLLQLAFTLVKFAANPFQYENYYSQEEKEQAILILKKHGYGKLCNLSQRCKKQTLALIEQAQVEA